MCGINSFVNLTTRSPFRLLPHPPLRAASSGKFLPNQVQPIKLQKPTDEVPSWPDYIRGVMEFLASTRTSLTIAVFLSGGHTLSRFTRSSTFRCGRDIVMAWPQCPPRIPTLPVPFPTPSFSWARAIIHLVVPLP